MVAIHRNFSMNDLLLSTKIVPIFVCEYSYVFFQLDVGSKNVLTLYASGDKGQDGSRCGTSEDSACNSLR